MSECWSHDEGRGFLISPDPLVRLDQGAELESYIIDDAAAMLEWLAGGLDVSLAERRFRSMVRQLPLVSFSGLVSRDRDDQIIERLLLLYSYFANAWIYQSPEAPATILPTNIARPLYELSRHVGRPPILAYPAYILANWRRIDPAGPIATTNLEVLQKLQGDADEAWFVLVHVEIEAIADSVLSGLREATTGPEQDLVAALGQISQGIEDMRISLKSMYDGCSPDAYYNIVRPYIFGFDGVVFEGVPELDGQPQSFRGLAAAQSSVVPTIVAGLGIQHEQTALIRNLDDMKQFMPVRHQDLIFSYEKSNTRSVVAATAAGSDVRAAYNRCLEALIDFRQQHYTIVQEYIHQPSGETSKIGTGGTMYLVWLKQLIDETGEHVLH